MPIAKVGHPPSLKRRFVVVDVANNHKALSPLCLAWSLIGYSAMARPAVSERRCSHITMSAKCAIFYKALFRSPPLNTWVHGASGLMGISTQTSRQGKPCIWYGWQRPAVLGNEPIVANVNEGVQQQPGEAQAVYVTSHP
jgi:hypothetical protein